MQIRYYYVSAYMANKQIQAPMRSKPFPFQEVIYLLIHFTACSPYWLLLPFTVFPCFTEKNVLRGSMLIHSPQQYLGLQQPLAAEKEGLFLVLLQKKSTFSKMA